MAGVRIVLGAWGNLGAVEFPKAREAAQRALNLDENLGTAHAALGLLRLLDWDFVGAGRALERAVRLSPNAPEVLGSYTTFLLNVGGRTEEALALSERMLRVAPFDVMFRTSRVGHFYFVRQFERALEEVERVRELGPNFVAPFIGAIYHMLGRYEEAHREDIASFERCGAPCEWAREAWERGWAEGGWEASRRLWLEVATEREGVSPFWIAVNYSVLGEKDEAFAWLERAYREHDTGMLTVRADPRFDPLRSDPRFDDLLRRIGFPES